jgi:hypothetical protein
MWFRPAVLILKIKSDGLWYSTCIDHYCVNLQLIGECTS